MERCGEGGEIIWGGEVGGGGGGGGKKEVGREVEEGEESRCKNCKRYRLKRNSNVTFK